MLYVFQKPEPLPEILWEPFFFLSLNDFVFRSISFKAKCIKLITFASRLGLKICQWNDNHRSLLESRAVGTGAGRVGGISPSPQICADQLTLSQPGGQIMPPTFLLLPQIFRPSIMVFQPYQVLTNNSRVSEKPWNIAVYFNSTSLIGEAYESPMCATI